MGISIVSLQNEGFPTFCLCLTTGRHLGFTEKFIIMSNTPMLVHSNGVTVMGMCAGCGLVCNCRVPSNVHLHPEIHGRSLGVGMGPSHLSSHLTSRTAPEGYRLSRKESYSGYLRTASLQHQHVFSRIPFSDVGYSGSRTESYDSGLGGSRVASSDSVCDDSSTAATSSCSTSNLVERYQKMSMHPHAEGKLRCARTDYQGLLTLSSAMQDPP